MVGLAPGSGEPETTGERPKKISEHPAYANTMDFVRKVYDDLGEDTNPEMIVRDENKYIGRLADYLVRLGKYPEQAPEKIKKFSLEKGTEALILHYENPIWNIRIEKDERIYEAIFAKRIEEERAKKARDAARRRAVRDARVGRAAAVGETTELTETSDDSDVAPTKQETVSESVNFERKEYLDPTTGYRILVLLPDGFDGGVDMYFPGDTMTIERALSTKPLLQEAQAKWKRGQKSAFVIVEGDRGCIAGDKDGGSKAQRAKRYAKLGWQNAFSSLIGGLEGQLGRAPSSLNIIGHSRGGSAINKILGQGFSVAGADEEPAGEDETGEGTDFQGILSVSCLDSTYWDAGPMIAFARRGGRLNVAFKSHTATEGPARKIISELRLKKVASGHWQSEDGKVNVHDAKGMSHRAVAQQYVGRFMGNTGTELASYTGEAGAVVDYATEESQRLASLEKPGVVHGSVLAKVEAIDESIASSDRTKIQNLLIEDVRSKSRLLNEKKDGESKKEQISNLKDEAVRRLRAYTSARNGDWYTIDYASHGSDAKGLSHELYVGLGDILLDPDIKEILVERGGQITKAHRGVVPSGKHAGRVGFLDSNNRYVSTHTGDRFRILSTVETNLDDASAVDDYYSGLETEESSRVNSGNEFINTPVSERVGHDPGSYNGPTIDNYVFDPKERKYPSDYYVMRKRSVAEEGMPPEMPQSERDVPLMGYSQALNYYERMIGRPSRRGWTLSHKEPLSVFGTIARRPNIIMACILVELEHRCKQMGMDLRFKHISVKAAKGGRRGWHPMGMAVDFDAPDNRVRKPGDTTWTLPPAFTNELQKMGLKWGMYFHKSRKDGKTDAMHFDIRASLPNIMAMLTSERAIRMAQTFQVPGQGVSLYEYAARLRGGRH